MQDVATFHSLSLSTEVNKQRYLTVVYCMQFQHVKIYQFLGLTASAVVPQKIVTSTKM